MQNALRTRFLGSFGISNPIYIPYRCQKEQNRTFKLFLQVFKAKNTLSGVYNDNDTKEQGFSMCNIEAKEKLNLARTKRRIVREGIERLPASVRVAPCFLVLPCYMLIARQRWFIARNIFYARMRCVKISIFLHF